MNRPTPLLIALAALTLAAPVLAQDASAPAKVETARPQGPVDNDNPVVKPRPSPVPANTQAAAPAAAPQSSPAPSLPATSPKPSASAKSTPSPSASPSKAAKDKDEDRDDGSDSKASATETSAPEAPASAMATASAQATASAAGSPAVAALSTGLSLSLEGQLVPGLDNRLLAGLLALFAAMLAGLIPLRLAKRQSGDEASDQWTERPSPATTADTTAATSPASPQEDQADEPSPQGAAPDLPPLVMPAGEVAEISAPVALSLDPVKLSASLLATTFNYRLEVTNVADFPLENLAIGGGMISAHASLPVDHQLGTDGQLLTLLHRIPLIGAGETVEVSGDLRLPLNEITPVRSGDALLFIPIARFRVEVMNGDATSAWVIGETPPVAAAALLPFRIDLGPRIWTRISKRLLGPAAAA